MEKEPNFKDIIEMSDEEFSKRIEEEEKRDFSEYGRDGYICVWRNTYCHKGIKYDIAMLRYYQIGIPIYKISGINRYSKWFVLEYPTDTKNIVEIYKKTRENNKDFLWRDTSHIWNYNQTLEEMFDEIVNSAKNDIDDFVENTEKLIDTKVSELIDIKNKFNNILKNQNC